MSTWNPESPFLETTSFTTETWEQETPVINQPLEGPWTSSLTPFLRDEYETQGLHSAELEAVSQLLSELRDEAFEDNVYRLAAEAVNFLGDRYNGELGEAEQQAAEAERQVEQFFSPLIREAENMYERLATGLERQDLTNLPETELENLLNQYEPTGGTLQPEFQNFLGGLFRKATSLVKGAVNWAKRGISAVARFAIRPLLNRLKRLVWPVLRRVIRYALNRLPAGVRPIAQQLARRLFGVVASETESVATSGAEVIQQEYDLQLAELLLASEEEAEQNIAEFEQTEALPADPAVALHAAKERFIQEFSQLQNGQDPTPVVQNFLPVAFLALRPVLRTVLGIIGRQRVVNFFGRLIGRLIERWVGPEGARQLAPALADVGLRLIGFEAPGVDQREAAIDPREATAEVIAETLEQTVLQLAQLPEEALEDETMLEAYTREAFEQAASAYFPDGVIRSELRETARAPGRWISRQGRRRRKYYLRYSRIFDVEITPQVAANVKIFGGSTLADFFKDVLLLPAERPVRARVYLYELALGSRLIDIALREKDVPGLGNARWQTWSQIHPLTPEAALALFGEPGLGKPVDPMYLAGPYLTAIGQRFYYLQIPGLIRPTTPTPSPTPSVQTQSPCVNRIKVIVNLRGARVVIRIQFSESTAQEIAQALRRRDAAGAWRIARTVDSLLRDVVKNRSTGFQLIGFELEDYLGMSTEGQVPTAGDTEAEVFSSFATKVLDRILGKVIDLLWAAIANYFTNTANEFIRAADDPADGVTMYVSFVNIPGLATIRNFRRGGLLGAVFPSLDQTVPRPSISVYPGCNR